MSMNRRHSIQRLLTLATAPLLSLSGLLPLAAQAATDEAPDALIKRVASEAVSYTHLDVYKRQHLSTPGKRSHLPCQKADIFLYNIHKLLQTMD